MTRLKKIISDPVLFFRYLSGQAKLYHYGDRKPLGRMLRELISWRWREGEFNSNYYAFGLNLASSRQEEFIGRKSFLKTKKTVEDELRRLAGCSQVHYDAITKDKFYANSIFSANGIRCIPSLAIIHAGKLIFPNGKQDGIEGLLGLPDVFYVKNTVMESGSGVYRCCVKGGQLEVNGESLELAVFGEILGKRVWVVQQEYSSHALIRAINDSALNTTRIVTILNGGEPEYLGGFQGFATGSARTDSWSGGSIYVGLDPGMECLKEHGITAITDRRNGLLTEHPDSKVAFGGYPLPLLKEAIELCLRAHRLLYFNFIIGWDVAITDDGPLIVEANERPGMNVAQCLDGGMRKKIAEYAKKSLSVGGR